MNIALTFFGFRSGDRALAAVTMFLLANGASFNRLIVFTLRVSARLPGGYLRMPHLYYDSCDKGIIIRVGSCGLYVWFLYNSSIHYRGFMPVVYKKGYTIEFLIPGTKIIFILFVLLLARGLKLNV